MVTTVTVTDTETSTTTVEGDCYNGCMRNSLPASILTRGCSGQIIDEGTELNATGITGNVELIYTNSSDHYLRSFPILRNREHIYMPKRGSDVNPYSSKIAEYNLLSKATNYLEIGTGSSDRIGSDNVSATVMGYRRLFATDMAIDYGDSHYYAFILDFEANTVTEELDVDDTDPDESAPLSDVLSIQDSNGDIHLVGFGDLFGIVSDYCGMRVWHKNYTDESAWTITTEHATDEGVDVAYAGNTEYYTIVNNRYVVMFQRIYYRSGSGVGMGVYVFDIVDDSLDYTDIDYGSWESTPDMIFISVDHTNNKCYVYGSYYDPDADNNQHLIEFDPSTMAYSSVFESGASTGVLSTLTSNTHSYFYDDGDDSFYQSSNQALKFNYTLPHTYSHERICFAVDDGDGLTGELVWFINTTTKHLYSIDMSGDIVDDLTLTITLNNYTMLFHLGNCLLLVTYDSVTPYNMYYYLIT